MEGAAGGEDEGEVRVVGPVESLFVFEAFRLVFHCSVSWVEVGVLVWSLNGGRGGGYKYLVDELRKHWLSGSESERVRRG